MATKTPPTRAERLKRGTIDLAARLDRAIETTRTVIDALSEHYGTEITPDGDWIRTTNRAGRRVWRRRRDTDDPYTRDERVILESNSVAGGWRIYHCTPDGRIDELTDDVCPRAEAFERAERVMDDLARVPLRRRTGRTAVAEDPDQFEADMERLGVEIDVE